uniref:Uncharacterized protein n=1 Tax=Hyaloperonospora arabidopsidis (strain Emoy2) TaxID=559515 RepID=M4BID2_HYAAE
MLSARYSPPGRCGRSLEMWLGRAYLCYHTSWTCHRMFRVRATYRGENPLA